MKFQWNINWKKIGVNLLYPHLAIIICLLPIAITLLILSLIYLSPESILAILSYLLSFYVLLVICFRIPRIINFFKEFKNNNKYIQLWLSDVHLRMNVSLYGSLIWNIIFAIFQLVLGFHHKSFWFYSLAAYYIMLGLMRFFLFRHTKSYKANEQVTFELQKSILCGWLLLAMNIALAVIVFFMVYWNRTFNHHMITVIFMAAYTFTTFSFAIINLIKYKKYQSPVYSTAKSISLISGAVSMLTLETTMLTTFGGTESPIFRKIILSITGVVVIGLSIVVAITLIVNGNKKLKNKNNTLS